jgi:tryptophanyl-tRNA synthetase
MWVLNTLTYMGELNRMTQFKDKSKKHAANINSGLFTYPVLMAADILIYQADLVPVGADQKQHLELTRDLAGRFNTQYSDTFVVPKPYIPKAGARIMSLQEPEKKMSKSDANLNNLIAILDSPDVIKKKIKRAVTDSGTDIKVDKARPGISNLIQLYSLITDMSVKDVQTQFSGKMYSDFKSELGNVMAEFLAPIQKKYDEISKDKPYLESVLAKGAESAHYRARKTLTKVYRKVGFIPKKLD